jgi:hypothetical protein
MQTVIGIILLISFFAFIYYAAKGGNMLLGLFSMAILWSALGAIGGAVDWKTFNNTIIQGGPEGFGPTAVNIMFGSWFGRILIETGIARTIIRKAVELGGDKPTLTTVLLCIVVAGIFTTAYGAGAVVAIGVIVFPIMLSLGISKPLATGSFCMAVSAGLYFNSSLLSQAAGVMLVNDKKYDFANSSWYTFAAIAFILQLLFTIALVIVQIRKESKVQTRVQAWAAAEVDLSPEQKNVNFWACLTPILPVFLAIAFKLSSIFAIVVSVVWALLWTGNCKNWNNIGKIVEKTFHEGTSDVGLVLAFLLFMQMFAKAAGSCKTLLAPIVSPILPTNIFLLFLVFGLLGILALFRGPMTIWGAGTATFAIVAGTGLYPLALLYPLFYIPCVAINTSICPTQSWVSWAIGYNKVSIRDFLKRVIPYALVLTLVLEVIAYFIFGLVS